MADPGSSKDPRLSPGGYGYQTPMGLGQQLQNNIVPSLTGPMFTISPPTAPSLSGQVGGYQSPYGMGPDAIQALLAASAFGGGGGYGGGGGGGGGGGAAGISAAERSLINQMRGLEDEEFGKRGHYVKKGLQVTQNDLKQRQAYAKQLQAEALKRYEHSLPLLLRGIKDSWSARGVGGGREQQQMREAQLGATQQLQDLNRQLINETLLRQIQADEAVLRSQELLMNVRLDKEKAVVERKLQDARLK